MPKLTEIELYDALYHTLQTFRIFFGKTQDEIADAFVRVRRILLI